MVARDSVLIFFRLRLGPFEGPANVKPPALPEVSDFFASLMIDLIAQNPSITLINQGQRGL
jgi:hypothetical protein